jgi:hypothetical protein
MEFQHIEYRAGWFVMELIHFIGENIKEVLFLIIEQNLLVIVKFEIIEKYLLLTKNDQQYLQLIVIKMLRPL